MTSLKCVHAMTLGAGDMSAKRRSVAHSKPTPSAVKVPFPNSSMMHRDLPAGNDACSALLQSPNLIYTPHGAHNRGRDMLG